MAGKRSHDIPLKVAFEARVGPPLEFGMTVVFSARVPAQNVISKKEQADFFHPARDRVFVSVFEFTVF
jgi:hypothetical protein